LKPTAKFKAPLTRRGLSKYRKDKCRIENNEPFHAHFLHECMKSWENYEGAIADYMIGGAKIWIGGAIT
jgi:hypothetical protein